MMTFSAATASALPDTFTALSAPDVAQGTTNQAVGSVTLDFANDYVTNSAQTFTINGNSCSTAAGIAKATEFAAVPTAALTGPFLTGATTAGTATKPAFTTTLSSSTTQCATAGITDVVTLTLAPAAATGTATDWFKATLSNVKYNVGTTAPTGLVALDTTGDLAANASVNNANVVDTLFSVSPVITAQSSSTGNTLGTASFVETTPGAFFPTGDTVVVLTLSAGATFTDVLPTIKVPVTVPAYTATAGTFNAGFTTFTFTVKAPATPIAATVSVSGLKITGAAGAAVVTLKESLTSVAVNAARVVDFNDRTGGSDRYSTAAALFTAEFAQSDVVLASGVNFPDALSANYLAGQLGTGTLLTTPNTLPTVVRQAMFTENIKTVYITGGTGAVSQAVQDQIEAMHVGNVPTAAFLTVVRLGGSDRYDTNRIVNNHTFVARNTVMLATGKNFADALTVGPIASQLHFPLILTQGLTLGASETSQLSDFNPTNVVIAGGTGVVSQAIEDSLKAQGYKVVRLSGSDRTLTAAQVAEWATTGVVAATGFAHVSLGFDSTTAYITTGNNFADALAAGPVAGSNDFVIMPTNSATSLGAGIPLYFGTKTVGAATPNGISVLHALGLTGAVSNAVMTSAAQSIG